MDNEIERLWIDNTEEWYRYTYGEKGPVIDDEEENDIC